MSSECRELKLRARQKIATTNTRVTVIRSPWKNAYAIKSITMEVAASPALAPGNVGVVKYGLKVEKNGAGVENLEGDTEGTASTGCNGTHTVGDDTTEVATTSNGHLLSVTSAEKTPGMSEELKE